MTPAQSCRHEANACVAEPERRRQPSARRCLAHRGCRARRSDIPITRERLRLHLVGQSCAIQRYSRKQHDYTVPESEKAVSGFSHIGTDLTQQIIGAASKYTIILATDSSNPFTSMPSYMNSIRLHLEALTQVAYPLYTKTWRLAIYLRRSMVEGVVICEIKAIKALTSEHEAQLLHYLKATGVRVGLLINFGSRSVQVRRLIF